jgi:hypothetical protein
MATILYDLLRDFQGIVGTVITGVVGFTGVILTLKRNAENANRLRLAGLAHDAETTRLTLSSELSVIERSLRAWREAFDEERRAGRHVLARSFNADGASRAYRAALPKIGLLNEREIQQTVLAYSEYEALGKMSADVERDARGAGIVDAQAW